MNMIMNDAYVKMNDTPEVRFQNCINASKRVRWDIEEDVIRGRTFDVSEKFLPDGLSLVGDADFLSKDDKMFVSQIQGRTYANVFGLVERFINAKMLELGKDHWFEDQTALEAIVRFSDEEIKHQALFRRVDELCANVMPTGYSFPWDANDVSKSVLEKSTWAVLMLTLHIELFTQSHYRESIDKDATASVLFKDIFKFHWMEESQHAIIDELELRRIDAMLEPEERDVAVDEFIDLVCAVDGILNGQAKIDAEYFAAEVGRPVSAEECKKVNALFLKAYRWQYILSGAMNDRFQKVLGELINEPQGQRIQAAVGSLQ